jgi:hypothetical protein
MAFNSIIARWVSPLILAWERLGGIFTSPPRVVAWGPNRLDLLGLGTYGAMDHKAWDGNAWRPSLLTWSVLEESSLVRRR